MPLDSRCSAAERQFLPTCDRGVAGGVLGMYGNRTSTTSAAPTGEMDSTEVIYLPTPGGPMANGHSDGSGATTGTGRR